MKLIRLAKLQPRIQRAHPDNGVSEQATVSAEHGRCNNVAQRPSNLKQDGEEVGELCVMVSLAK